MILNTRSWFFTRKSNYAFSAS